MPPACSRARLPHTFASRRTLTAVATLVCAATANGRLPAQEVPPPAAPTQAVRPGERLRFRFAPLDTHARPRRCSARVVRLAGDTVVVGATAGQCPRGDVPATTITALEVARGSHGSRLAHTVVGMVVGATVGGLAGRLYAGNGCQSSVPQCDDGGFAIGVITLLGVGVGAVGGGFVGLVLPAGPRWVPTFGTPPLRVTAAGDAPPG